MRFGALCENKNRDRLGLRTRPHCGGLQCSSPSPPDPPSRLGGS